MQRSRPRLRTTAGLTLLAAWIVAVSPVPAWAQPASAYCMWPHLINWPAANPVWSLCWVPPDQSSGISGSGLELRHVFYKAHRVFWQAHLPVLNVLYDGNACGPYRDWQNSLMQFEADNVLQPGYAEPTVPPRTVLDHPGSDAGTFEGVAVEKRVDRLILTTQMQAGWYRYIQKWTFFLNGTIEPRFGFSAVTNPCTPQPHNHHAYWRFDFDIDGFANDVIERVDSQVQNKVILPETAVGAPALANVSDVLLAVAWTGTDAAHHLNVASAADGHTFGGKVVLNETSIDGPGLAAGDGRIFFAWTGTDASHHVNVIASSDLQRFGNKVTLNETSPYGPALAFGNSRLYLGDNSASAPGLSFVDGKLYLLWRGTDANHSLNVMESADGVAFTNKVTLGDSSNMQPGLARQSAFELVWTGRDPAHRLNRLSDSTSRFDAAVKATFDDTSIAGLSLVTFRGQAYVTWTGTDAAHHVNVAPLGAPWETAAWAAVGESSGNRGVFPTPFWRVRDKATNRGYVVLPEIVDGVADAWAVADAWFLRYHSNEIDDGGATGGSNGDAIHVNNFINGEDINGQDIVLWYRAGHRHAGPIDRQLVGPTLRPFGAW